MANPHKPGFVNKHGQVLLREPMKSVEAQGLATCEFGCLKCGLIHCCDKAQLFDCKCPKCATNATGGGAGQTGGTC